MKTILTTILAVLAIQLQASESALSGLLNELQELTTLSARVKALEEHKPEIPADLSARLEALEGSKPPAKSPSEKFTFILENDPDGYADESWESIIYRGQALQRSYWEKSETEWGGKGPSLKHPGWSGTAGMPIIKILCVEPEYKFRNTARLPGRFEVTSSSRWGSILRLYGDGEKVLVDTLRYGYAFQCPVGIYVEPRTIVSGISVKPFEQRISNVILSCHNGTMPVYLAINQDRFSMQAVKVLQHNGALIGVKHGPVLTADWYPVEQPDTTATPWLTDPVFSDLQMEGPHSNQRPQAMMYLTGANIKIYSINIYGWLQGPYLHSDLGATLDNITMYPRTDNITWCDPAQQLPYIISQAGATKLGGVGLIVAPNPGWYIKKGSPAPATMGWHVVGERTL